jgi:hypothetical protein
VRAAKDLHFNKNMEALKKMQAGADKLATVVGVTLGPKVRQQQKDSASLARKSRQAAAQGSDSLSMFHQQRGCMCTLGVECSRTTQLRSRST